MTGICLHTPDVKCPNCEGWDNVYGPGIPPRDVTLNPAQLDLFEDIEVIKKDETYVADRGDGHPCFCVGPQPGHALCPCMERASGVVPDLFDVPSLVDLTKEMYDSAIAEEEAEDCPDGPIINPPSPSDPDEWPTYSNTVSGSLPGGSTKPHQTHEEAYGDSEEVEEIMLSDLSGDELRQELVEAHAYLLALTEELVERL